MKKDTLSFVAILLLVTHSAFSQKNSKVSPCFHDELMHYQNELTPGFRQAVDKTYQALLQDKKLEARGNAVYTINVVFHVVYKNDEENVSLARLNDQIAVLNEAYRRKNADTTKTRALFKPFAGDAQIEFRLDRVVRVKTTALFKPNLLSQTNQIPNQVKKTAQGGSDAVDPDRYLNIWMCKIEPLELLGIQAGAILGFAYPPAGLSNWPTGTSAPSKDLDGVVVDYRTVGKTGISYPYPGRATPLSMQGRTMVHEVGHYLGLRHTSGDVSLLGLTPSCDGDDGISDTPKVSAQSEFDCDNTKNTCSDSPIDYPDMIENYMDYSAESCMNMFTKGQIAVMRSVLEGPRKLLIQNVLSNNDLATHFKVSVSPNPTEGLVQFHWQEPTPYILTVSDMLGRVVHQSKQLDSQTIDLSAFTSGLYFFDIRSAGRFEVVKVLVQK